MLPIDVDKSHFLLTTATDYCFDKSLTVALDKLRKVTGNKRLQKKAFLMIFKVFQPIEEHYNITFFRPELPKDKWILVYAGQLLEKEES